MLPACFAAGLGSTCCHVVHQSARTQCSAAAGTACCQLNQMSRVPLSRAPSFLVDAYTPHRTPRSAAGTSACSPRWATPPASTTARRLDAAAWRLVCRCSVVLTALRRRRQGMSIGSQPRQAEVCTQRCCIPETVPPTGWGGVSQTIPPPACPPPCTPIFVASSLHANCYQKRCYTCESPL